jgi:hypothetical protein
MTIQINLFRNIHRLGEGVKWKSFPQKFQIISLEIYPNVA